jgi:hypothetical protein
MLVAIFACLLIYIATLTYAGGTDIPLDFYTDNACAAPSTTAANISLELGVCSVTPGLGSFVLQPYPCSSGDVVQYAFSDTACGQPNSASRTSIEGYCYAEGEGGDIAAIMLSCDQTSPGQPTSTTTITVGPIATGGSNSSTSSTTGSGGGSSSSSDPSSPASGWNSLSLPVRIVIIVGVSVSVLSAILGGSYKRHRRNAVQQTDRTYTETFHMSYRALA